MSGDFLVRTCVGLQMRTSGGFDENIQCPKKMEKAASSILTADLCHSFVLTNPLRQNHCRICAGRPLK